MNLKEWLKEKAKEWAGTSKDTFEIYKEARKAGITAYGPQILDAISEVSEFARAGYRRAQTAVEKVSAAGNRVFQFKVLAEAPTIVGAIEIRRIAGRQCIVRLPTGVNTRRAIDAAFRRFGITENAIINDALLFWKTHRKVSITDDEGRFGETIFVKGKGRLVTEEVGVPVGKLRARLGASVNINTVYAYLEAFGLTRDEAHDAVAGAIASGEMNRRELSRYTIPDELTYTREKYVEGVAELPLPFHFMSVLAWGAPSGSESEKSGRNNAYSQTHEFNAFLRLPCDYTESDIEGLMIDMMNNALENANYPPLDEILTWGRPGEEYEIPRGTVGKVKRGVKEPGQRHERAVFFVVENIEPETWKPDGTWQKIQEGYVRSSGQAKAPDFEV